VRDQNQQRWFRKYLIIRTWNKFSVSLMNLEEVLGRNAAGVSK